MKFDFLVHERIVGIKKMEMVSGYNNWNLLEIMHPNTERNRYREQAQERRRSLQLHREVLPCRGSIAATYETKCLSSTKATWQWLVVCQNIELYGPQLVENRNHLTYSMAQSPSWEANRFAASQEIPRISRNPKAHYRTHKRPPAVSILDQPNPAHIPTSHLLEIHLNIIHPSAPRSPQWSPSLRFPHQDPIHPPLLNQTRLMPSNHLHSWNQAEYPSAKYVTTTTMNIITTEANSYIYSNWTENINTKILTF